MRRSYVAGLVIMILLLSSVAGCQRERGNRVTASLTLATTTSTYDSGLLHYLLPDFEARHNIRVDVISVGTGQAVELGKRGDADILLVHAPNLEDAFVSEGFGTARWDVMYNDYIYLGPKGTAGDLKTSVTLEEALVRMTEHMEKSGTSFLSRGDNSGTHNKEKALWPLAGLNEVTSESWYLSMGQGMGDTLMAANEMRGYVLTDRGTYLAMRGSLTNLETVFEGAEDLFNPYGIIPVNPHKHPNVKYDAAMLLVEFFTSEETKLKISEFGVERFGQPLFFVYAR